MILRLRGTAATGVIAQVRCEEERRSAQNRVVGPHATSSPSIRRRCWLRLDPSPDRILTREYAFALRQGLFVQLWCTAPNPEGARAVSRFARTFGAQIEATFSLIEHAPALPNEEVRAEFVASARENRNKPAVLVIGGTGFRAATVRAIASSVVFLAGHRGLVIFGSVEDGVAWIRKNLHIKIDPDDFASFLSSLRQERLAAAT